MACKIKYTVDGSSSIPSVAILKHDDGGADINSDSITKIGTTDYYEIIFTILNSARYTLEINGIAKFDSKFEPVTDGNAFTGDKILETNSNKQIVEKAKQNGYNLPIAIQAETEALAINNKLITPKQLGNFLTHLYQTLGLKLEAGVELSHDDFSVGVIVSNGTGVMSSETKQSAFNKAFGQNAGQIPEGNHIHNVTKIAGMRDGSLKGDFSSGTKVQSAINSFYMNGYAPDGCKLLLVQICFDTLAVLSGGTYSIILTDKASQVITLASGQTAVAKNTKYNIWIDANSVSKIALGDMYIQVKCTGTETISGTFSWNIFYEQSNPIADAGI